jgi:ubiquinone/menaquinone biosynthesis C-methylase UbiE
VGSPSLPPVPGPASSDFDRHRDTYREAVEDSISFCGADLDFFTHVKVERLLEISELAGPPRELSFLDVGCGTGETDSLLEGRVGGLSGVDVSHGMLERARQRNPWVSYRSYGEGDRLPFNDGSHDVCFAICVFHHVARSQRPALVEEMKRVCRPGGAIAIFEHNPWNPLTRRAVRACEFDADAELLSRREASGLMTRAGLEPRGRYIEFFPREGRLLRRIETGLGWLPLGAQYAVFAQRP